MADDLIKRLEEATGHVEWLEAYLDSLLQDRAVRATFAREHAVILHAKVGVVLETLKAKEQQS